MHVKITFENSDANLAFIEKDSRTICEVNAYVEAEGQETWDLKPPLTLDVFLKDVTRIESLALYKNKASGHVGVSANLELLNEGMCGCEFTISKFREVNNFPRF